MLKMKNKFPLICLMSYFHNMILAINISISGAIDASDLKSHPNWNLLPHDVCGLRAFKETTQIATSGSAYFGQFPWMVYLVDNNKIKKENIPKCGGTIINKKYVLTTSYCCRHLKLEKSRVQIGEFNMSHKSPECTSQECMDPVNNLRIEEIVLFPEIKSTTKLQDHVCLIRLKNNITFNDYVRPICLPVYENLIHSVHEGDEVQFAGLRKNDSKLAYISWPVISDTDCKIMYPPTQNQKLCLGFKSVEEYLDKKGCYANAGNAVMKSSLIEGKIKTYVLGLYGRFEVLNYLICDMELPKIFTKVSEYTHWILDSIKI